MTQPLTPVEALSEIAFLMERQRASSYRVKAFRQAARAVAALSEDVLGEHIAAGTISSVRGIGKSSATVIEEAASGAVPKRLQELRDSAPRYLFATDLANDADVAAIQHVLDAIQGDCHSHSNWSDGGSPINEMADAAMKLGRKYLALTDHSPSLRVANGLSAQRLAKQLVVVDELNADYAAKGIDFEILKGIEVDIREDGSLDQDPDLLDALDVRVASVHSKLRADVATMTERMLGAIRNPHTTILGHCTGRLVEGERGTRPPSEFDAAVVFAACAEHSVAVEINARPERCDPPDDLIHLAMDAGCYFSLDSDAHAPGQLDFLQYGAERIARLGVDLDRVITTWSADRVRAFANKEIR